MQSNNKIKRLIPLFLMVALLVTGLFSPITSAAPMETNPIETSNGDKTSWDGDKYVGDSEFNGDDVVPGYGANGAYSLASWDSGSVPITHAHLFANLIFSKSQSGGTADSVDLSSNDILNADTSSGNYGQITNFTHDDKQNYVENKQLLSYLTTLYEYQYITQPAKIDASGGKEFLSTLFDKLIDKEGADGKAMSAMLSTSILGTKLFAFGSSIIGFFHMTLSAINPIGILGLDTDIGLDSSLGASEDNIILKFVKDILAAVGININLITALRVIYIIIFVGVGLIVVMSLLMRGRTDNRSGATARFRHILTRLLVMVLAIPLMWYGSKVIDEVANGIMSSSKTDLMEISDNVVVDTLAYAATSNFQLPDSTDPKGKVSGKKGQPFVGAEPTEKNIKEINEMIDRRLQRAQDLSEDELIQKSIQAIEGLEARGIATAADYVALVSNAQSAGGVSASQFPVNSESNANFVIGIKAYSNYPYLRVGQNVNNYSIKNRDSVVFLTRNPQVKDRAMNKKTPLNTINNSDALKTVYFNLGEGTIDNATSSIFSETPRTATVGADRYKISSFTPVLAKTLSWENLDTYIYGVVPAGASSEQHKNIDNYINGSNTFQDVNLLTGHKFIDTEAEDFSIKSSGDSYTTWYKSIAESVKGLDRIGPYSVAGDPVGSGEAKEDDDKGDNVNVEMTDEQVINAMANMKRNAYFVAIANKYGGINYANSKLPSLSTQSTMFLLQTRYSESGKFLYNGYDTIASESGSVKNTGKNGTTFYRYTIPHIDNTDLVTKISNMSILWIVAGVASILAAFYILRGPVIVSIIKQFTTMLKAIFTGNIVAVIGFLMYYAAMRFTIAIAWLSIGVTKSIAEGIQSVFLVITDGLGISRGAEVMQSAGFMSNYIPMYGQLSSLMSNIFSLGLALIAFILLSWPFFTLPSARGVKKVSVIEGAMSFMFIAADNTYASLNNKFHEVLYGKPARKSELLNGMGTVKQTDEIKGKMKAGGKAVAVTGLGLATGGITAAIGGAGTAATIGAGLKSGAKSIGSQALGKFTGSKGDTPELGLPENATDTEKDNSLQAFGSMTQSGLRPRLDKDGNPVETGTDVPNDYLDRNELGDSDLSRETGQVNGTDSETPDLNAIVDNQDTEQSTVAEQQTDNQDTEQQDVQESDVDNETVDTLNVSSINTDTLDADEFETDEADAEQLRTDEVETENVDSEETETGTIESAQVDNENVDNEDVDNENVDNENVESDEVDTEQKDDQELNINNANIDKQSVDDGIVENQDTEDETVDTQQTDETDNKELEINNANINEQVVDDNLVAEQQTETSETDEQLIDEELVDNQQVGTQQADTVDTREQIVDDNTVKDQETGTENVDTQQSDKSETGTQQVDNEHLDKSETNVQQVAGATTGTNKSDNIVNKNATNERNTDETKDNKSLDKDLDKLENKYAKGYMREVKGQEYNNVNQLGNADNPFRQDEVKEFMAKNGQERVFSQALNKMTTRMEGMKNNVVKNERVIEKNNIVREKLKSDYANGKITKAQHDKGMVKLAMSDNQAGDTIARNIAKMDKVGRQQQVTVNLGNALHKVESAPGIKHVKKMTDQVAANLSGDRSAYLNERKERGNRISNNAQSTKTNHNQEIATMMDKYMKKLDTTLSSQATSSKPTLYEELDRKQQLEQSRNLRDIAKHMRKDNE